MLNLLKADFNKILRTRFVHILFLIIVTFPLLSMLFFLALDPSTIDIDSNGYALIIDSYHPNNNAGLLISIMACVITCQEFSYGTIRNKMISGHKRWHIYLSLTLSTVIMTVPFFLINVLLNGLLGSFILGYGRSWSWDELYRLVEMTGVSLIIFLVYILSAVLISSLIRNTGLSLLVYIFINLAHNLSYITMNSFVDQNTTIQVLISFIPSYQLFSIMHEGYRRSIALQALLASSLHYLLLTSIGVFLFERRDIK